MCDLNEVASVIVNRAWEDPTYHKAAGNLCAYIMRVSQITLPVPGSKFWPISSNTCV